MHFLPLALINQLLCKLALSFRLSASQVIISLFCVSARFSCLVPAYPLQLRIPLMTAPDPGILCPLHPSPYVYVTVPTCAKRDLPLPCPENHAEPASAALGPYSEQMQNRARKHAGSPSGDLRAGKVAVSHARADTPKGLRDERSPDRPRVQAPGPQPVSNNGLFCLQAAGGLGCPADHRRE